MNSATLVRNAKVAAGRTHRQMAADAGVAASTVTRVQSERIEPTVEVLERLLDACGYDLQLCAIRKAAPSLPRFDDLLEAWERGSDGQPRLQWTRWRAWLDSLALHAEWVPEAIYLPPAPSGHVVIDSLIAAIAEKLADDSGLPRPSWSMAVPQLEEPYEPPARRRGVVPAQLERRGLMIDGESLFRAREFVGI